MEVTITFDDGDASVDRIAAQLTGPDTESDLADGDQPNRDRTLWIEYDAGGMAGNEVRIRSHAGQTVIVERPVLQQALEIFATQLDRK